MHAIFCRSSISMGTGPVLLCHTQFSLHSLITSLAMCQPQRLALLQEFEGNASAAGQAH